MSLGVAGLILLVRAGVLAGDYGRAGTEKEKDCSACDVGGKGGYAARAREGKRSTKGGGMWLVMNGLTASLAIKISCLKLEPESQSKKSLNIHFEGVKKNVV